MTITQDGLGAFGHLAQALGITDGSSANGAWFGDPMATGSNQHGLTTIIADDGQRNALVDFVDTALGPPDLHREGEQKWIPLFVETSPAIAVYAVVEPIAGAVRLGVGLEHTAGTGVPNVKTTIHVPVFHMKRRGQTDPQPVVAELPDWLQLGRPGGRIAIGLECEFNDTDPVPGEAYLRGADVQLLIPTCADDTVGFQLSLLDLQLPGATAPQTRTLDVESLATLGADVLEFVVGMLRQQIDALNPADPVVRHIIGLAGMLGLSGTGVPPIPLAELPTQGVHALVSWLEQIIGDVPTRTAWLTALGKLVGGTPDPATTSVGFAIGPATLRLGARVTAGAAGHSVVVPWLDVTWSPAPGTADLSASVDLMRLDTATGSVAAVPGLRAEALFGNQAHSGTALLTGTPGVGGVRVGIGLDAAHRPAFTLTLHTVALPGGISHDVVDLSSPQAAVAAVDNAVSAALTAALSAFGAAAAPIEKLLGIVPPANVDPITASALIADPLGAIRGYWHDLLTVDDAMADALGSLTQLLTGTTATPGQQGTAVDPWRLDIADGIGLRAWREHDGVHDAEHDTLVVALGADASLPVLTGLEVSVRAEVTLLRADLAAGTLALACGAGGSVRLLPTGDPLTIDLEIATVTFAGIGVETAWQPGRGLTARLLGDGLTVAYTDPRTLARRDHGIPLPQFTADGQVTFAPDWDEVEGLVTALLGRARSDVIGVLLDLVGWRGTGAHLRLGALIADPGTAIESWLLDLALDCVNIRTALGPVAYLLSGGSLSAPLGNGRPADTFRCPVAGVPAAPGLAVWTVPGCPPLAQLSIGVHSDLVNGFTVPDGPAIARALMSAGPSIPSLADLLVGRTRLGEGLTSLVTRWTGTDGIVGAPTTAPTGVTQSVLTGLSYAELVANGRTGDRILDGVGVPTDTVVHVGCEAGWTGGQPSSRSIDATSLSPAPMDPTGTGAWFVQLPTPGAVAAERPDHDRVAALAARLTTVLAGRTADVVLVGYGAAGAAAVRAAAGQPHVRAVVTVGTPWTALALTSLTSGLGGDAIRFLDRLVPDPLPPWSDTLAAIGTDPLRRGQQLVRRTLALQSPDDLPTAMGETLPAGVEVHAVFGALLDADVRASLASVAAAGISIRSADLAAQVATTTGPPTEVHVGVDLPVLDLDLGGLLIGVGARVDLASARRATPHVQTLNEVYLDVHLGVTDGWLVGGPGAGQQDLAVRWLEAQVHLPLSGGDGRTEFVLHEARAFTAYREAWVVNADGDGGFATTALPEVKILLSEIGARLRTASPELADLLTRLGVLRLDGVDPDAIDHLLLDPVATLRPRVQAACAEIAADLRTLAGLTSLPSGLAATAVRIGTGDHHVDLDLATGRVTGEVTITVDGLPPLALSVDAGPAGVTATAALGAFATGVGGARLVGSVGTGGAGLSVETRAPGATTTTTCALYPAVDTAALTRLATVIVPALVGQQLARWCRSEASEEGLALLDAGLSALGVLGPAAPSGARDVILPTGLFMDPGQWLRTAADPLAAGAALLEALAPVVVPTRPGGVTGWPLGNGLTITYALNAGRLDLGATLELSPSVGGQALTIGVTGGLSVTSGFAVTPLLDAEVLVGGPGLRLQVAPTTTLDLVRTSPAAPIRLYPAGAGLADAIGAAAESAVRVALNALVAHRNDGSATPVRAVARAVHELGTGLDLLVADQFTDGKIAAFVSPSPAAYLEAHLAGVVSSGLSALAEALDPTHTHVQVAAPSGGVRRITFGTTTQIHVDLDGTTPAISIGGDIALRDQAAALIGHVAIDELRLSPVGVRVALRAGPFHIPAGPVVVRPIVVLRAGVTSTGFDPLVSVGVGLDDAGAGSVEVRFAPSGVDLYAVDRTAGVETNASSLPADTAPRLLGVALDLASSILTEQLGTVVTSRATGVLQGVVFTGGTTQVDTSLFADFQHPERLLHRLEVLLWNAATAPPLQVGDPAGLRVTVADAVVLGLVSEDLGGGHKQLGINVDLKPGKKFSFPTSSVTVDLEVKADWITGDVPSGLSIFVVEGTDVDHLRISPAFSVAGLGVRFTKPAGPLLELGSIALDGIAVHVYAEANPAGIGGGAQLQLVGLAVAPGGSGNGVASGIMNDVGAASANNRPSFSPSVAVQKHPGGALQIGVRAGDPPGPWWLVIQRQLGPLYVDRIGLNTVEAAGRVTEISLLFSGQLSIFGLTAAVDQLSITWHNTGDILSISSWSVDLMGLAVSAVGSSRVDLQACKLEYSIVSPK